MPDIQTLAELLPILRERGDALALLELERKQRRDWRAAALAEQALRLAAALRDQGLEPGQRVLLYAPNSPHWIIACLAIIGARAVPVPVDSQIGERDLAHIAENSAARWAFTTNRLAKTLSEALGKTLGKALGEAAPEQLKLVLLDGEEGADEAADQRSIGALLRAAPETAPEGDEPPDPSAEAVLFYTSGTSGAPKGVPLTHRNLLSNLEAILSQGIVDDRDRLLLPLPLHHVYPFSLGLLAPLVLGLPLILPYSLTGPQLMRALKEGEATAILGIPRLYSALLAAIRRRVGAGGRMATMVFDRLLSISVALRRRTGIGLGARLFAPLRHRAAPQLRLLVSGGAALEPEIAWNLDALGWQIATGYGLTETSPILTFLGPSERRFDSAGRALPGVELRIDQPHDPASNQASDQTGGQGEVQARGPSIFGGYLDLPEKNAEVFTEDGWLRTGDLGHLDAEGWLQLSGRASSRIVLAGGENVDPERVEARLDGCPSVREAGVLGHEGRLAAVVVPETEAARDQEQDQLRQQISDEITAATRGLASTQQIDTLRLDPSPLPRTRLGKLRRHRLAERFEALAEGADAAPEPGLAPIEDLAPEHRQLLEDPTANRVWNWLGSRFPDRRITPESDLSLDLGVDSLEWVDLTLDLQQEAGLALEEDAIGRIERVRDLLQEAVEAEQTATSGASLVERLRDPDAQLDEPALRRLSPPPASLDWFATFLHALVGRIMRGPFRLRAEGAEQIPASGPCLLTPNHLSSVDPGAILAVLDHPRRRTTCWGGATAILFNRPWMRLLSRSMRVLPVDPSGNPLTSLALGAAALERGCMLIWFPEGRRSPDGQLQPFRSGIGSLALAHDVPILPVHIRGSREALPPGSLWPRARPVALRIGAPVDAATLVQEGQGDDDAERIANALQERVRALGADQ